VGYSASQWESWEGSALQIFLPFLFSDSVQSTFFPRFLLTCTVTPLTPVPPHNHPIPMSTNRQTKGPLGLKYHPLEKTNATADCLENQSTPHDLCDEKRKWNVEARVQALLEAIDKNPLKT